MRAEEQHRGSAPVGESTFLQVSGLVEPGAHLACIYETAAQQRDVIVPFVRDGLERNERVLYVADQNTADQIKAWLDRGGVDVELALDSQQLQILTSDKAYLLDGVFDPDRMLALLGDLTAEALTAGHSALRITGEMTWVLKGLPGSHRLAEYEAKLNRFFPGSRAYAMCQYDRRRFTPDILSMVLDTHPLVILGTDVIENPGYTPPEVILSPNRDNVELQRRLTTLVSQHKARREAESQRILKDKVLETAIDGYWHVSMSGMIEEVNDSGAAMLGYSVDELCSMHVSDVDTGESPQDVAAHLQEVVSRGKDHFETRHRCKDGTVLDVEVNVRTLPERDSVVVIVRDITERKQQEALLRASEARYSQVFHSIQDVYYEVDVSGTILEVSPSVESVSGYSRDELLGRSMTDLYAHPEKRQDFLEEIQQHGRVVDYEIEMRDKDGTVRRCSVNASLVIGDAHHPTRLIGSLRDISERKQAEDALLSERNRLGFIVAGSGLGTWAWNVQTNETVFNEQWAAMLGYTLDELAPCDYRTWVRLAHPGDLAESEKRLADCIEGKTADYACEVRMRHKDGHWVWILDRGRVMTWDDNGKPLSMFGTHDDITKRKQAEQALRESEARVRDKLDALLDPEGDLGQFDLSDVIDCEQIQSLMDDFYALTHIGVGILDLEGNVLVGTGWQDVCTKFHRVHPEAAKHCRESDTRLTSGIEPGTFKIYKCKNNLWDMATPIMVGGERLGNLFLGQFFFEDEEPDIATFEEQARQYGFDEDAYLAAYHAIPRWSHETVDRVMAFYCNLINVISRLSYTHIKLAQMTEALRQSEQRFRSFVENANDIVYALSPDGYFTYVSPNWLDLMGEPAENVIGKSYEPYVHPEDVHLCREFLQKVLTTETRQGSVEYRVQHRNGSWRWHSSNGSPLRDESGKVVGYVGIGRDMTEAKQIERQLQESEQRLQLAARSASLGIWDWDVSTDVMTWDKQMFRLYGLEERSAGYGVEIWQNALHPDDREQAIEDCRLALEGEQTFQSEFRVLWPDGSVHWIRGDGLVLMDDQDNPTRMIGVNYDITDRVTSEQALRESERELRRAQAIANLGSWKFDLDAGTCSVSAEARAIYGLDDDEYTIKDVQKIPLPEYRTPLDDAMDDLIRRGVPYDIEFQIRRPSDGALRYIHSVAEYHPDTRCLIGTIQDITRRKEMEIRLKNSEAHFRSLFENMSSGVAVYEPVDDGRDFVFVDINRAGERFSYVEKDQVVGKPIAEVFPGVEEMGLLDCLRKVYKTGQPGSLPIREYRDGRIHEWVENRVFRLPSGQVVALYEDRTKQYELEEHVRQMQKMDAVGKLAGGIAHDFNNHLAAILGYADLLAKATSDDRQCRYVENIRTAAQRSADLTGKLLAFSRKGKHRSEPVDVHALIEEVSDILQHSVDRRIRIRRDLGTTSSMVKGDPSLLQSGLLNLGLNARDAMPQGGVLTFRTKQVEFDEAYCASLEYDFLPGEYLLIEVEDTGEGMTPEVVARCFEPFFTTKEQGKGTGMGLAAVYGTVKEHGGAVTVESQPEKGTTVKLYLPRCAEPEKHEQDRSGSTEPIEKATIMLVDDESMLREMGTEMLESVGHQVIACADGPEALEVYRRRWQEIDLVILDYNMPKMNGAETYNAMCRINPDIRAVFSSGYAFSKQMRDLLEGPVVGLIQKPYSQDELNDMLSKALRL